MLVELMEHGMNIARLNFSHGDHEVSLIKSAQYAIVVKRSSKIRNKFCFHFQNCILITSESIIIKTNANINV